MGPIHLWLGGHRPTTQPLLADLGLDRNAELVLAVIDDNENPVVLALPLGANGVPTPIWQSTLEDGSILLIPHLLGLMTKLHMFYSQQLKHLAGDVGLEIGFNIEEPIMVPKFVELDGDSDVPHIRLPGQ